MPEINRFCRSVFDSLHVGGYGNIFICQCRSFMKTPFFVGNIFEEGLMGSFNSEKSKELRASILNNSFRYCKDICPSIKKVDSEYERNLIKQKKTVLECPPEIYLEYDFYCNLSCFHCSQNVSYEKEISVQAQHITDILLKEIDNPTRIRLVGGEVFASDAFLRFLREIDPHRIERTKFSFITNGVLLNEKMWNSLSNCNKKVENISISLDAATYDTYKSIRKANFNKVVDNLRFLGRLKKDKIISSITVSFVVQRKNFKEMGDMVDFCLEHDVDELLFQALYPRKKENILKDHVVHIENSALFDEYLLALHEPRLQDPIVNLNSDLFCEQKTRLIRKRFFLPNAKPMKNMTADECKQLFDELGFDTTWKTILKERLGLIETHPTMEESLSTLEPWPLRTNAKFRVLAWPDYNSHEEIETLIKDVEQISANNDMCLCLRYDQSIDIEWNSAIENLTNVANTSEIIAGLDILIINDEMKPSDWRRLGKSVNRVIGIENAKNKYRTAFLNVVCSEVSV
ncbi:MAG: radical SAM protein [Proteobacteria bacterium]|nr:radical SAM protein [Pseudomonadota bacterium]